MENTDKINTFFSFGDSVFVDGLFGSLIAMGISILTFYLIYKFIERVMIKKEIENEKSILNILRGLLMIILFFIFLSRFIVLEGMAKALIASSGILALILGVAAQETIGNLISGIMVIIFKPFVVGDLIKINDEQLIGFVEEINLRHTIIKTYENNRIIVPNNEINQATIENANLVDTTKGNYLSIPVAYTSDIDLAVKIIEEECIKHPEFIDTRSNSEKQNNIPPVIVRCTEFKEYAIILRCTIGSEDSFTGFEMLSDLRFSIKKRFDEEGIQIPFNHLYINK